MIPSPLRREVFANKSLEKLKARRSDALQSTSNHIVKYICDLSAGKDALKTSHGHSNQDDLSILTAKEFSQHDARRLRLFVNEVREKLSWPEGLSNQLSN